VRAKSRVQKYCSVAKNKVTRWSEVAFSDSQVFEEIQMWREYNTVVQPYTVIAG